MSKIRRYFVTGLLITLPVFFTFYVLFAVFRFIDGVWGRLINYYLKKEFGFFIPGLGIILGLVTVFLIGFVATNLFGKSMLRAVEMCFLNFPRFGHLPPAIKQIVDSFMSKERPAFKQVVLVKYPSEGLWSVGFLTNEGFAEAREKTGEELMHVFIATSPSPFTGFLVLVPKQEITFLDIPIEEGIKLIVSGGIVKP